MASLAFLHVDRRQLRQAVKARTLHHRSHAWSLYEQGASPGEWYKGHQGPQAMTGSGTCWLGSLTLCLICRP